MYTIRVHYDNGDSLITRINASVSEIVSYYLDRPMYGGDLKAVARAIEFLDAPPARLMPGGVERLRRVYSLSGKTMERRNLYSKFRCTFHREKFIGYDVTDCAYIPGMFDHA